MNKVPEYQRQGFATREDYNKHCRDYRKNNKHIFKKIEDKPIRKFAQVKRQAIHRKLEWNLSIEEFMSIWQKPCEYCGAKIDTIGIDRIDSNKGYSPDNIRSCCKWCNTMKLNHTTDEFIAQCSKILSNFIN